MARARPAPTNPRVMSAIYHLGRNGRWPTSQEIADHLEADPVDVKASLRHLRDARLFRDRMRAGRKVWTPWEAP